MGVAYGQAVRFILAPLHCAKDAASILNAGKRFQKNSPL